MSTAPKGQLKKSTPTETAKKTQEFEMAANPDKTTTDPSEGMRTPQSFTSTATPCSANSDLLVSEGKLQRIYDREYSKANALRNIGKNFCDDSCDFYKYRKAWPKIIKVLAAKKLNALTFTRTVFQSLRPLPTKRTTLDWRTASDLQDSCPLPDPTELTKPPYLKIYRAAVRQGTRVALRQLKFAERIANRNVSTMLEDEGVVKLSLHTLWRIALMDGDLKSLPLYRYSVVEMRIRECEQSCSRSPDIQDDLDELRMTSRRLFEKACQQYLSNEEGYRKAWAHLLPSNIRELAEAWDHYGDAPSPEGEKEDEESELY